MGRIGRSFSASGRSSQCSWNALDGTDWSRLLRFQSAFSDRCPWKKLDGENWDDLLGGSPGAGRTHAEGGGGEAVSPTMVPFIEPNGGTGEIMIGFGKHPSTPLHFSAESVVEKTRGERAGEL